MTATNTTDGIQQIPPIGRYQIDIQRSAVTFKCRHLFGLARVRGTFAIRNGVIDVTDPVADSRVQVQIDTASFHTGNRQRDRDVRSARPSCSLAFAVSTSAPRHRSRRCGSSAHER